MSALRKPATMRTMRLRKVHCAECGYTIRMARTWIVVGLPDCPNPDCSARPMECADPADAIDAGLLTLAELPRKIRTEVCRANGWEDEIIRTAPAPRSTPKQCKAHGCGSFVRKGELYCRSHADQDMPF